MTVTASYVLHRMPPLLAPVLPPPPLQCVLHPEECSGRSAEGDWCGQGCSAQCAVQPSPDRCLYTVDCIHSPPPCAHRMASLLSCAPAAQPPALSRRRDNLFFLLQAHEFIEFIY